MNYTLAGDDLAESIIDLINTGVSSGAQLYTQHQSLTAQLQASKSEVERARIMLEMVKLSKEVAKAKAVSGTKAAQTVSKIATYTAIGAGVILTGLLAFK